MNILRDLLFDIAGCFVGDSVITDEIIVVSGWISYVPLLNFVHNVNAICDLSSWYLLIKSFGDNFSVLIRSKIKKNIFWNITEIFSYFVYDPLYPKKILMVVHHLVDLILI